MGTLKANSNLEKTVEPFWTWPKWEGAAKKEKKRQEKKNNLCIWHRDRLF